MRARDYLLSSRTAFTRGSTSGGGLGGITGTSEFALSAGALDDGAAPVVEAVAGAAVPSAGASAG